MQSIASSCYDMISKSL